MAEPAGHRRRISPSRRVSASGLYRIGDSPCRTDLQVVQQATPKWMDRQLTGPEAQGKPSPRQAPLSVDQRAGPTGVPTVQSAIPNTRGSRSIGESWISLDARGRHRTCRFVRSLTGQKEAASFMQAAFPKPATEDSPRRVARDINDSRDRAPTWNSRNFSGDGTELGKTVDASPSRSGDLARPQDWQERGASKRYIDRAQQNNRKEKS